ncbi:DNA-binding transcriptional LysR family regulator [Nocardiopsis mwathae]|uniref:DNA-binding transcriptional LysR family regulator n=1 Tax=Nocardiopsis mwathae TaxID=1472723 RepID=A0A7X0D7C0_9ACTN|nr:LysR family transcriptional regulator [Nocardiopsis mwathae]MBB6174185.1 DNA-binding transcriptional LysR family regulator [Nocardiopsis mwathae]
MVVGLHHLRCFLALAEEQQFTGAAERLGISQPTLSRSIRRLEELLGRTLVDRASRHTRLTAEGVRLHGELRVLLPRLETALRPAGAEAPLRLGYAWGFPIGWGRSAIGRFEQRHNVLVHTVRRDDRLAGLADGTVDAALVWGAVADPDMTTTALHTEPRIAAVSTRSTLAGRHELTWAELGRRCIVLNTVSGTLTPDHWPTDARPEVGAESTNIDEYLHAVASRRGVGVLPVSVSLHHHDPDVLYIPITDAPPAVLTYAVPRQAAHPLAEHLGITLHDHAHSAPHERPELARNERP